MKINTRSERVNINIELSRFSESNNQYSRSGIRRGVDRCTTHNSLNYSSGNMLLTFWKCHVLLCSALVFLYIKLASTVVGNYINLFSAFLLYGQ